MIGNFVEARTKEGPVLVVTVFNATPVPKALCILGNGMLKMIPIDKISADWHYGEKGWEPDFPDVEG